jgi:hypothetical protein
MWWADAGGEAARAAIVEASSNRNLTLSPSVDDGTPDAVDERGHEAGRNDGKRIDERGHGANTPSRIGRPDGRTGGGR